MPGVSRVILDTNLWISFLLTKDFSRIDKLFKNHLVVLLFSEELLTEFIEVATRPKFKKYISSSDLQSLLLEVKTNAEFITVISKVNICRDPKDNFLLALAKDGKATHLITGDKDLLDLKRFKKTIILNFTSFISEDDT